MKVTVPPGAARGSVNAPASKSAAHRALIAASLAKGESVLRGVTPSDDIEATLDSVSALGAVCDWADGALRVRGTGGILAERAALPCRQSGSTLRFLIPVALAHGGSFRFTGAPRLIERGIGLYERMLAPRGVSFWREEEGIRVKGKLSPGDYELPGDVSSQFVTGMLFALPLLPDDSTLTVRPPVESRPYIDITRQVLGDFGVDVREDAPNRFFVPGGQAFRSRAYEVEGDWSNAAFLLALGELGGAVRVAGLNESSLQGDRAFPELAKRLEAPGAVIDLAPCPDLGPILFALAAAKRGARFIGTRRLRIKESDRAAAMAEELGKFGAQVRVGENEALVRPGALRRPVVALSGHDDHRVVMALSVLGTLTGCEIEGAEAVSKSYPGFFEDLKKLGVNVIQGDKES